MFMVQIKYLFDSMINIDKYKHYTYINDKYMNHYTYVTYLLSMYNIAHISSSIDYIINKAISILLLCWGYCKSIVKNN